MSEQSTDTLGSTFDLFFGPQEETHGTGTAVRPIKGELTEVVVDASERAAWLDARRAEADARNAKVEAQHQAEAWYYSEEPVG